MVQLRWKTIWQFLTKLNIVLPYDPAITLLSKCLPNWVENISMQKPYRSFVFRIAKNCKTLRWLGKQLRSNHTMERLFSDKINEQSKPWSDMREPSVPTDKWKKPVCKGNTLCGPSSRTFAKRHNYGDSKRSVVPGSQGEKSAECVGEAQGHLEGWTCSVWYWHVGTRPYQVVEAWRRHSTKSKPWGIQFKKII